MNTINYDRLPEHMRESMRNYIEEGYPVGGFLAAVLENKLVEAFAKADTINEARIRDYVLFLFNEAPSECWGSAEKVAHWQKSRRETAAQQRSDAR